MPEWRHAGTGAGDGGVQGEGAGRAGRGGIQAAGRTGRIAGYGAEVRCSAGRGHHVFARSSESVQPWRRRPIARKAPPQPCLTINAPSSSTRILPWATGQWATTTSRLGEPRRASEYLHQGISVAGTCQRAGKAGVTADYYQNVTGELDKAAQTYQEEIESYPREAEAYTSIWATCTPHQGQYEKATEITTQALHLAPDSAVCTKISPTTPLPCSASTKRGRSFTRRRRENWMSDIFAQCSLRSCLSRRGLCGDGGTATVVCGQARI